MKRTSFAPHGQVVTIAVAVLVVALLFAVPSVYAQQSNRPITSANFAQDAPRGFGDRQNSWAQAMEWWQDHLYVGTSRASLCTSLYSIWEFVVFMLGKDFADTWFPYPPNNPDLACADGPDLSLQAEIWRWDPQTDIWSRAFQSPLDLDNPGPAGPIPPALEPLFPFQGKKVPYEIAFRGLTGFTEPDGTEALYAFGVNSTVMWDRAKLPPPRVLRTTDGLTWTPLPQTPGTFLGDLPFNPDHSSFRSPVTFGGKLFVICGPIFGQGSLIGSADPAKGDDAWFLASPPDMVFYEAAAFNGWLYLGTIGVTGYTVVKTRAEGQPPYQFVTVIPPGAYLPSRPSRSVVSMHVYNNRLWVGTATQTEVIRINPDDTWDLVVGPPRAITATVTAPGGATTTTVVDVKYPISNLDAGFGHTLNDHAWQMNDPYRYLYTGTYNASIAYKDDPTLFALLGHNMGAHLYRTRDGWYYSPITTNGFADANPYDPNGGKFDYGIRTMASTPYGAFFGTANDYYGIAIFRADTGGSSAPDPPDAVEIEPTSDGAALLSWQPLASKGFTYEVYRAEIHPIQVRDDVNIEAWSWNNPAGNKIPDTYVDAYTKIGETTGTRYKDATVQPGKRYMYYVIADTKSLDSDPSNLNTFPRLIPPTTFASLLTEVNRVQQRQRYRSPDKRMTGVIEMIQGAQAYAAACDITSAIKTLDVQKASNDTLEPEAADIVTLVSKLIRRLTLYRALPGQVVLNEVCTTSSKLR